jgi:hypothetical protein
MKKTIQCPECQYTMTVEGEPGESKTIICPKCNISGKFTFTEEFNKPSDYKNLQKDFDEPTSRPLGVTILAIFAFILALFSIYGIINIFSYLSISSSLGSTIPLSYFVGIIALFIAIAVVYILIGYGFLKGLRWSWYLALIILIVGIFSQIGYLVLFFAQASTLSMIGFEQSIGFYFICMSTFFIISVAISVIVIFYLRKPSVREFFNTNEPGEIKRTLKSNINLIYIIVAILAAVSLILIWGFTPTDDIELVDITHTIDDSGAIGQIQVIAEITGGSPFGGASPRISYNSYFSGGSAGGSRPMESIGNDRYSTDLYGSNGTEIWCLIIANNKVIGEYTIQVGDIERSDVSTLSITNVVQTPENPTSDISSVKITADIDSNVNISDVSFMKEIISPSGAISGGGGGGDTHVDNTYTFTISTYFGGMFGMGENQEDPNFQSGSQVYYRIAAKDETGNTAIYTDNFTIN